MLDDRVVERLFGMVLAKLERPDEEFVSAKQLHGAGLERKDADPERRAPTLQAMYQSFQKLSGVFLPEVARRGPDPVLEGNLDAGRGTGSDGSVNPPTPRLRRADPRPKEIR